MAAPGVAIRPAWHGAALAAAATHISLGPVCRCSRRERPSSAELNAASRERGVAPPRVRRCAESTAETDARWTVWSVAGVGGTRCTFETQDYKVEQVDTKVHFGCARPPRGQGRPRCMAEWLHTLVHLTNAPQVTGAAAATVNCW